MIPWWGWLIIGLAALFAGTVLTTLAIIVAGARAEMKRWKQTTFLGLRESKHDAWTEARQEAKRRHPAASHRWPPPPPPSAW